PSAQLVARRERPFRYWGGPMKSASLRRHPGPRLTAPREPDELTPAWMTAALQERYPKSVVARVEPMDIMRGTTNRARLRLHYAAGEGPALVFAKANGPLSHRLQLAAFGVLMTEAELFARKTPLPIEMPDCYAAAIDRRR